MVICGKIVPIFLAIRYQSSLQYLWQGLKRFDVYTLSTNAVKCEISQLRMHLCSVKQTRCFFPPVRVFSYVTFVFCYGYTVFVSIFTYCIRCNGVGLHHLLVQIVLADVQGQVLSIHSLCLRDVTLNQYPANHRSWCYK